MGNDLNRPGRRGGLDEALLEAVDEALLKLSEGVRHSVYWYLKCRYGFGREDIPSRPGDFEGGLRALFGRGADIILRWAIEALYERLGLTLEDRPGWGFADYVAHAREEAERRGATR
ncbi:MAG: hypothetical protein QXJ15_06060 [Candidatus Bathyarchaeia archaeon]